MTYEKLARAARHAVAAALDILDELNAQSTLNGNNRATAPTVIRSASIRPDDVSPPVPYQISFTNDNDETTGPVLTDSHDTSLDSQFKNGDPAHALIYGPQHAQATFFDDQLYRLGQNA